MTRHPDPRTTARPPRRFRLRVGRRSADVDRSGRARLHAAHDAGWTSRQF